MAKTFRLDNTAQRLMLFAVISALISFGVLPTSCGEKLPFGFGTKYKNLCHECDGDGKAEGRCMSCFGRGYYAGAKCTVCGGDGKVDQTCPFCGGSGKKPSQ